MANALGELTPDTAQAFMPEGVPAGVQGHDTFLVCVGTFSRHNNRIAGVAPVLLAPRQPLGQEFIDPLVGKGVLGNQDQGRPPGHRAPQGQMTGMTPHDLDHLHPVVRAGRGARLLNDRGAVA